MELKNHKGTVSWQHPVPVVGGAEPYIVNEWPECLNQLQSDRTGNWRISIQEHLTEHREGHPSHLPIFILQHLCEAFSQGPYCVGLCGTQCNVVKP